MIYRLVGRRSGRLFAWTAHALLWTASRFMVQQILAAARFGEVVQRLLPSHMWEEGHKCSWWAHIPCMLHHRSPGGRPRRVPRWCSKCMMGSCKASRSTLDWPAAPKEVFLLKGTPWAALPDHCKLSLPIACKVQQNAQVNLYCTRRYLSRNQRHMDSKSEVLKKHKSCSTRECMVKCRNPSNQM